MSDHAGNQPADQHDQRVENALDADPLAGASDDGQDEGLDDMVSRLLSELDEACDAAERSLADDDAAEAAASNDPPPGADEPPSEAETDEQPPAESEPEPEPEPAEAEDAPVAAEAEELSPDASSEAPPETMDDGDPFADSPTIGEVDSAADLDDAVAALTEELMGDDSSPLSEPEAPTAGGAAVDPSDTAGTDDAGEPNETEAPAEPAAQEIVDEAPAPAPTPAPAPSPAAQGTPELDDATGGLGDLDDAIAALTSELIDGEFLDAAGETTAVQAPNAEARPSADAPSAPEPTSTTPAPVAAETPPAETRPATAVAAAEPSVAKADVPKSAWKPKLAAAITQLRAFASLFAAKAAPLGEKIARLMSAPLNSRPKAVRDLIGWAGLITVFYAVCLWFVVLFLRSPQVPMAEGVPTGLVADTAAAPVGDN